MFFLFSHHHFHSHRVRIGSEVLRVCLISCICPWTLTRQQQIMCNSERFALAVTAFATAHLCQHVSRPVIDHHTMCSRIDPLLPQQKKASMTTIDPAFFQRKFRHKINEQDKLHVAFFANQISYCKNCNDKARVSAVTASTVIVITNTIIPQINM